METSEKVKRVVDVFEPIYGFYMKHIVEPEYFMLGWVRCHDQVRVIKRLPIPDWVQYSVLFVCWTHCSYPRGKEIVIERISIYRKLSTTRG